MTPGRGKFKLGQMASSTLRNKAIAGIQKQGGLLVYPIKNKKEPESIWSVLFPRTEMKWSWDEDADNRVGRVWLLKEELSRSGEVVYGKWFKGRATFLSFEAFKNLRAYLRDVKLRRPEAHQMLEVLEMDSPLSTKQLKVAVELQGRLFESTFTKAQRELFEKLEIVGFGEVNDSAFPSMAVGAAKLIFEELCQQSDEITSADAEKYLLQLWGEKHPFMQYARQIRRKNEL